MSAALSWVREAFEYQIKYLWGKCKTFLGVSKWEIAWAMIGYSDITTYMFIKSAYEENFSWCGFIFTTGPVASSLALGHEQAALQGWDGNPFLTLCNFLLNVFFFHTTSVRIAFLTTLKDAPNRNGCTADARLMRSLISGIWICAISCEFQWYEHVFLAADSIFSSVSKILKFITKVKSQRTIIVFFKQSIINQSWKNTQKYHSKLHPGINIAICYPVVGRRERMKATKAKAKRKEVKLSRFFSLSGTSLKMGCATCSRGELMDFQYYYIILSGDGHLIPIFLPA